MAKESDPHLDVEVLTVVRELASGDWTAFPVADPSRVSYGTEVSCLEEQRLFLGEYLAELPATELGRFTLPEGVELLEAEVVVPRGELPRRLRSLPPIAISCVVIPNGRAAWVVVLPLRHTFYAEHAESWRDLAEGEIARVAAARELDPAEYLELLPPVSQRLERLRIEVTGDSPDSGGRRKSRDSKRRKRDARRLLEEIGTPLGPAAKRYKGKKHLARTAPIDLIGREQDLATLESLIGGKPRLSVVVTGRELVGKSALIETALARRDHVYVTSGARLLAGQSCFGQWQERAHRVMRAAELLDAVLYFDNLADLFSARGSSEDIAGLMRPYLERRCLRLVAELPPEIADQAALSHVGFFGQLHQLKLEPLDAATTRRVLAARAPRRRPEGPAAGPELTGEALDAVIDLAERYLPYRAFPGKAVRLHDELLVAHAHDVDAGGEPVPIDAARVFEAVSLETGIPAFMLRDDPLKLEEIVRAFRRSIVGQRQAVDRVAEILCTVKARLQPAGRPLAVFLFVGPTGVGKTELARVLAGFLFGSARRLLRFDMSEYMDPWAAERLIRGTDREQGMLTRMVRQQPFSVLLLDEIEKADTAVFDLLLQVMGEARLSDAAGRTAYFHNTIVIMTSNLGAAHHRDRPGFQRSVGATTTQHYYQEQVEEHFRPEFVNRLDRVVAFEALSAGEVRAIGGLAVRRLSERHGLRDRGIDLDVATEVLDELAREGYDPAYGARRLYRHLEHRLVAPIANLLARLGSTAEGSVLEVRPRPAGEVPAAGDAAEDAGPLRVGCRRRATKPRASARAMDQISGLRRSLRERLRGERLRELEERLEGLGTQLAYGGRRGAGGRRRSTTITDLRVEHHRLNRIWNLLDDARREVEEVEELAIHAYFDGEPIEPFLEPARAAAAGWHAALPHALVALEPERDEISLMLTECDRWRGLDLWLAPLIAEAPRRDWSITGHFFRDPETAGPRPRWGPPRGAAKLGETVAAAERGRRVLLRVSGPDAGIFLATEAGIHRFLHAERCDDAAHHLEIERLVWRAAWTGKQLKVANSLLNAMPQADHVASSKAVRCYDFKTGKLTVAGASKALVLPHATYWQRFDEIVCAHLLVYEDDPSRDRDRELQSARLEPDSHGIDRRDL